MDSLLLPTTQKFEINVNGYWHVIKRIPPNVQNRSAPIPPRGWPSPQLLLDYRCHAPGGAIGRDYPPQVGFKLEYLSKAAQLGHYIWLFQVLPILSWQSRTGQTCGFFRWLFQPNKGDHQALMETLIISTRYLV